jgi:hypothetical protein
MSVIKRTTSVAVVLTALMAYGAASPTGTLAGEPEAVIELIEGTGVLLDITSGSESSGNSGNSKTTSSSTHIFAPAAFADYKRFGGEPTVTVDRYPFPPGFQCAPTAVIDPCPKPDLTYDSAPNGFVFPRYSQFFVSDDLGQSFGKPARVPVHGLASAQGEGGGDSYQAVGQQTHFVYFVDLAFDCITMNVSDDFGHTWRSDDFGCGLAFLDDRQWVEADEAVDRVYVSTINLLNLITPTLAAYLNTTGSPTGGFVASPCNPATFAVGANPTDPAANDAVPSPCPDPADPYLWVAGPVVADNEGTATRPPSHDVYVPFIRRISEPLGTGLFEISAWELYIAKSTDEGASWTRHRVATLPGAVDPANIFPQLTIDRAGNLYYTWSQAQAGGTVSSRGKRTDPEEEETEVGEQDVYYTYSENGGVAWAPPINLTPERNASAIFPWMVAGDAGRVDVVYYQANNGENSNVAPPTTTWNVKFGQSMNALNPGANFSTVQVTPQPNHIGGICTGGLSCSGDRDLLDFFTVDVDSRGAALIAYSDDNRRRSSDTQDLVTRQISGPSVFKNQTIDLVQEWPIRNHSVTDRAADVFDTTGAPKGSCPGMDVLATSVDRRDDRITVNLTLNGAPKSANAVACGGAATTGGLWGAEFWAASDPATTGPSNRFYIAYRDNPPDGFPGGEGGTMDHVNATITSLDFNSRTLGTVGGDCLPTATGTCTLSITVPASSLGITPGSGLYHITGLSAYLFGNLEDPIPATRVVLGNSEQADAAAPFHYLGSGTP